MHAAAETLRIRPRYYRWHVDEGVEWDEAHTGYGFLDWEIPLSRAALVLVDVWDGHYLQDTAARAEEIVQEKIRPLLKAARRCGLRIIHAPSPAQAKDHPEFSLELGAEAERDRGGDDWPPAAFRAKSGPFQVFARPFEPREREIEERTARRRIHPDLLPEGEDVVVATGAQLHLYCRRQGLLFLFYLGFNTNACILLRDYGTLEMSKRGYEVILLRDCTTGMESFETRGQLWQTRGAVLFLEMFGKYSITSAEMIAALPEDRPARPRRRRDSISPC